MTHVAKTAPSPTDLGKLMLDGIASGALNERVPPVDHYHAFGLYGRRIYCEAGTLVVTKKHKQQHLTIALSGRCTVVDEHGAKTEVVAPAVFVTEPGTQRSVYCHTDVEWITCHHTHLAELDAIEADLVEDTTAAHRAVIEDRADYRRVIDECGIGEDDARRISEQEDGWLTAHGGFDRYMCLPSAREGTGIFALREFSPGDLIGAARIGQKRTSAGRYANHSKNPNARFVVVPGGIDLEAIAPILPGSEITVNYRDALAASLDATKQLEGSNP